MSYVVVSHVQERRTPLTMQVCATWHLLPYTVNYRFFRNFSDPAFHDTRELFYLTHRLEDLAVVHTYTFTKPHLLASWQLSETSRPDQPPDMRYEYPAQFDGIVALLWRAWVQSELQWGHRPTEVPRDV